MRRAGAVVVPIPTLALVNAIGPVPAPASVPRTVSEAPEIGVVVPIATWSDVSVG